MSPEGVSLVERAILFAVEAHRGSLRKGGGLPYIVHPVETLSIVAHMTNDPEVLAAAVLHDVVEDTRHTADELEKLFGKRVTEFVRWESENKRRDQPPSQTWRIRKEETIARDRNAPLEIKILLLADKLSNMRGSVAEYRIHGDKVWEKFNMKDKDQQAWYYRAIAEIVPELADTPVYQEYVAILHEVFGKE